MAGGAARRARLRAAREVIRRLAPFDRHCGDLLRALREAPTRARCAPLGFRRGHARFSRVLSGEALLVFALACLCIERVPNAPLPAGAGHALCDVVVRLGKLPGEKTRQARRAVLGTIGPLFVLGADAAVAGKTGGTAEHRPLAEGARRTYRLRAVTTKSAAVQTKALVHGLVQALALGGVEGQLRG